MEKQIVKNKEITTGRGKIRNVSYINVVFKQCTSTVFEDCVFEDCDFKKSKHSKLVNCKIITNNNTKLL